MNSSNIVVVADNITSPLGATTRANVEACLTPGCSAVHEVEEPFGVPATLPLGLMEGTPDAAELALRSVRSALAGTEIDPTDARTLIIVSTTKGGIPAGAETVMPDDHAISIIGRELCRQLCNPNAAITVSNACVSGVSAQRVALEQLGSGRYDTAIVVGVDTLSRFIIAGFMSFKALSAQRCHPFEDVRDGLNLGEAAATIILQRRPTVRPDDICLVAASTHNDANHISGPSRTGEGSYRVLSDLLRRTTADELAFVSPHGTATPYNDEMESIAMHRAGLDTVPLMPLKARYGHTLGAAGVLETVLSCHALRRGCIYGADGYANSGVSYPMNISANPRTCHGRAFIKLISGFGGVNAGVLYRLGEGPTQTICAGRGTDRHTVTITPSAVTLDGCLIAVATDGSDLVTALYKEHVGAYPKFYKMDRMTRLGFVAAEMLLKMLPEQNREECAVLLFNSKSCYAADKAYCETITADNYYPAPALFVYTLANIVTGEIAIRHKLYGATCFYVQDDCSDRAVAEIVDAAGHDTVLYGVVEWTAPDNYYCKLTLRY